MADSYALTKLDSYSFENLVNMLALKVLGEGHTGFGPGADGGRDGFFEGEAPYPSQSETWNGTWYIQSKFHKPHLSKDPQKWLLEQIKSELSEFEKPDTHRKWPDNWIVATNIDPSGVPMTGAFDKARKLVKKSCPGLEKRFHIWGGNKIISLLVEHSEIASYYNHFLTPGHILSKMWENLNDEHANTETILRYLIITQLTEQQYTKLDQAGSSADSRPGIHKLFVDLPFKCINHDQEVSGNIMEKLLFTNSIIHLPNSNVADNKEWREWYSHPSRARVWLIKGGPGQGKSTTTQYFCQLLRASIILEDPSINVTPQQADLANEINSTMELSGHQISSPRVPIIIELREYAQWYGMQEETRARGVLTYLVTIISKNIEEKVLIGTLKRLLGLRSWFVVFDGLDEVPSDVKDDIASEVRNFIDNVWAECNADMFCVCTSRPQGYAGQFDSNDWPTIQLSPLHPEKALECASLILSLERTEDEFNKSMEILRSGIESEAICQLMTTPLQSHIMAVIVRDGARPPERRWQLFTNFYDVIRRREANRNLPDVKLAKLLREDEQLLKTVHNRLGFVLHARAENSTGAETSLDRIGFKALVTQAVEQMIEGDNREIINILMEATAYRLVLVSTPDDSNKIKFDVRPLQEFFAAEFIYETVSADDLRERVELISADSHWVEVMHFLLSALVENGRNTELSVVVEALEQLDSDVIQDENGTRLVNKRFGRGALLSARLLREGVLEQDKRIRNKFRNALVPLYSFVDIDRMSSMVNLKQSNSSVWLNEVLIQYLDESSLPENIGASLILLRTLPDNNRNIPKVKDFIFKANMDYVSHLFSSYNRSIFSNSGEMFGMERKAKVSDWLIDVVLEYILNERWKLLSHKAINGCFKILEIDTERTERLAMAYGLNPNQVQMLLYILSPKKKLKELMRTEGQDIYGGLLRARYFDFDWTTGGSGLDVEKLNSQYSNNSGILSLTHSILIFSDNQIFENFKNVMSFFSVDDIKLVYCLPPHLSCLLPIGVMQQKDSIELEQLLNLNETEFKFLMSEKSLRGNYVTRPVVNFSLGENQPSDKDCYAIISEMPELSVGLWTSKHFWNKERPMPESFFSEKTQPLLIDSIINNHSIIIKHVDSWKIFLNCDDGKKELLRSHIIKVSKNNEPTNQTWRSFKQHEKTGFELVLPIEACLLPHIINSILDRKNNDLIGKQDNDCTDEIKMYTTDTAKLKSIIVDKSYNKTVRGGAMLSLLLIDPNEETLSQQLNILLEMCEEINSPWFVKSLTSYLYILSPKGNDIVFLVTDKLLNIYRTDYSMRMKIEWLFNLWIESTTAPVQTSNVLDKWLAYGG